MRTWLVAVGLVVACSKGGGAASGPGSAPPPPGSGAAPPAAVTRDDCRAILEKADKLIGQDPSHPRSADKIEREIDECMVHSTPQNMACAKAATTYDQLKACEK